MKITVLGTRGFPGVQGGVEVHCEKLYPRLAKLSCNITVFARKPYVDPKIITFENINLVSLACPKSKSLEAIVHTFKGILAAKKLNPDLLHVHAVGPSLLIPLARILGLKTIMTNHGPDYNRQKWGIFAKLVLRLGEMLGSYFANQIICVSQSIADEIKKKYNRSSLVIPNGIEIPKIIETDETLKKYALEKNKYILTVGRYVPEKGFKDLIEAFNAAELKSWKLVIVGSADHESDYSRELRKKANNSQNVVLTGFLSGEPLEEIYSHAGLFVLPSYHEGLPLVLLEAMSYGLVCLVSDIPANRSIFLPKENYFKAGDIKQLSEKIKTFVNVRLSVDEKAKQIEILRKDYDWNEIARKTLEVYNKAIATR